MSASNQLSGVKCRSTGVDFADLEYKQLSLRDKLRLAYEEPHPLVANVGSKLGSAYFLFISTSEVYLLVFHVIPREMDGFSDTSIYYVKFAAWFVFLQCIVNWLLVFFTQTSTKTHHEEWQTKGLPLLQNDDLPSRHCDFCKMSCPFRAHHCKLCRVCILKRDHHCYFTGVCIGYFNQRFFIILTFYIVWAGLFGYYFIPSYIDKRFDPIDYWDYVLPVTCYHFLFSSHIDHVILIGMFQIFTLWWTTLAGLGFFIFHVCYLVPKGLTSHEVTARVKIRCTAPARANFRDVFGAFWVINFLFPVLAPFVSQQGFIYGLVKLAPLVRLQYTL
ncbi:hypothetical protein CAPTEDRAFT_222152 [Capitella teleta]|uniref:Palmitoyltransferase n=1 Tax=Capitella teleta TaxID=283909 RepID=X2ASW9_CAPTE|nr:hypothetical protein CAPTEDRAFT_222152 [Capitella teleta]|eukprot:ELT88378.1 hypothetical protein CAPTEDRAFT_222152 [Capitella teleta]